MLEQLCRQRADVWLKMVTDFLWHLSAARVSLEVVSALNLLLFVSHSTY